jgi:hypothetical protein
VSADMGDLDARYRMSVGPVEATERAAEDAAIQILLAGLEVDSIRELKRLVDKGRATDRAVTALERIIALAHDPTHASRMLTRREIVALAREGLRP